MWFILTQDEIIIVRNEKDWRDVLSTAYSDGECTFRFESPKGKPGDVMITEYLPTPADH